jgi:hypothetical protein
MEAGGDTDRKSLDFRIEGLIILGLMIEGFEDWGIY